MWIKDLYKSFEISNIITVTFVLFLMDHIALHPFRKVLYSSDVQNSTIFIHTIEILIIKSNEISSECTLILFK